MTTNPRPPALPTTVSAMPKKTSLPCHAAPQPGSMPAKRKRSSQRPYRDIPTNLLRLWLAAFALAAVVVVLGVFVFLVLKGAMVAAAISGVSGLLGGGGGLFWLYARLSRP